MFRSLNPINFNPTIKLNERIDSYTFLSIGIINEPSSLLSPIAKPVRISLLSTSSPVSFYIIIMLIVYIEFSKINTNFII